MMSLTAAVLIPARALISSILMPPPNRMAITRWQSSGSIQSNRAKSGTGQAFLVKLSN